MAQSNQDTWLPSKPDLEGAELLLNFWSEACSAIPKASPTALRPSTSWGDPVTQAAPLQSKFSIHQIAQRSDADTSSDDAKYFDNKRHTSGLPSTSDHVRLDFSQLTSSTPDEKELSTQLCPPESQPAEEEEEHVHGLGLLGMQTQSLESPCDTEMEGLKRVLPEDVHQERGAALPNDKSLGGTKVDHKGSEYVVRDAPFEMLPEEPSALTQRPDGALAGNGATPQKDLSKPENSQAAESKPKKSDSPSICASCNFSRNSIPGEIEANSTSWISCDGCRKWFHFACAGFRSEREVRAVDKYRCKSCKPVHGPTTYVRKSARAHSAIDYAGLNEGVIKTSDEDPEHHYVKDFKNGKKFTPENFMRMRPELVTANFFSRGDGMKEPILIPAAFNPRPRHIPNVDVPPDTSDEEQFLADSEILHERSVLDTWLPDQFEYETVEDEGQDALDMVIPHDLTVRKVSELYGSDEKIEVIDVKSQNGEDKRWTMKRWVDYYESTGEKVVRNVISLEVSQSKLGYLIRRPKVVRDLDLQDAVWPADLVAKGEYPKVQFYCLMSVADCYTDFHIDFGGSSVYYHILKGKKTFFFIPPHEKHLKKYEEWCNSPAQNWTFLGDQTKECYRVDLSEGDTMLIPAGWIHAVWTPEDSLVIGGNFLTPLHYPLQIRVAQIEKATNVARKFRYPHFQKVLWYAALHYLDTDPIPDIVVELLTSGQIFERSSFSTEQYDAWGDASLSGPEDYQARYYGKAELEGLPELCRYLLRTALIASGNITDGISVETKNAVKRSIPKGHHHGEPLDVIKKFALWCSWKRGNETIPFWAYPDYIPEGGAADQAEKKLSVKARRKLDRDAAYQAFKIAPDRQSTRARQQPQNLLAEIVANQSAAQHSKRSTPAPSAESNGAHKRKAEDLIPNGKEVDDGSSQAKKPRTSSGSKTGSARRPACEACRKSRRACKHRDDPAPATTDTEVAYGSITVNSTPTKISMKSGDGLSTPSSDGKTLSMLHVEIVKPCREQGPSKKPSSSDGKITGRINDANVSPQSKPHGRTKACKDCRKSKVCCVCCSPSPTELTCFKRRCVHDEFGNEDPVKLAEASVPRPAAKRKKAPPEIGEPAIRKKIKIASANTEIESVSAEPLKESTPVGSSQEQGLPEIISPVEAALQPVQPSVDEPSVIPVDPELLSLQPVPNATAHPPVFSPEDEVNLIATSPLSDVKCEPPSHDLHAVPPLASSLASPPESTHTDTGTPPATVKLKGFTPPTTSASSRQSSHPAKQQETRYTPESEILRRPSTSSGGAGFLRDSHSPTISIVPSVGSTRRKSRTSSAIDADEESLRLIRELQAQDLGLRRRGRS